MSKCKNAITYILDNCILKVRIIGLEPTRQNTHFGTFWHLLKTLQKVTLAITNSILKRVFYIKKQLNEIV